MGIITKYDRFINEYAETSAYSFVEIFNLLIDVSTEDILEFRDYLNELLNINESFATDLINKLKIKFQHKLDDKIWKYLINKKRDFYGYRI